MAEPHRVIDPKRTETASRLEPGPTLLGAIDILRGDRIAGWAIDRRDPAARLEIEILREGETAARVIADRPRPDLERGGVGDGRYGFVVDIAPPVQAGFEFTLSALARAADGAAVALRSAAADSDRNPDRQVLERLLLEVVALRREAATQRERGEAVAALARMLERIEIAQARLDAALTAAPAAPERGGVAMRALLLVGGLVAAGSLAGGVWSLLSG